MQRIVIVGGGFAGLWSAAGAARKLDELDVDAEQVEVVLVNPDAYHGIRVRFYETDLSRVRVPLDQVLAPIGVRRIEGRVEGVDFDRREIAIEFGRFSQRLAYDRLVLAAGSQLCRPEIPGLAEHAASVDTYWDAQRLDERIADIGCCSDGPGPVTALVVGAGLTGIETACELPDRLRECLPPESQVRVVLADHAAQLGSTMGEHARPIILEALAALGVETRSGVEVVQVDRNGATLASGERIDARIVVWTAGMRASPLTKLFPVERDALGRLPVDEFMKVRSLDGVFAAGDVARAMVDAEHASVMSCQHARPMGRFAGHNVVCDLLGLPPLAMQIDYYVTILDLGRWGALYTQGWDRQVRLHGPAAKQIKQEINGVRIYPPLTGDRRAIFAAAAPVIQPAPALPE